jgi:hypothetical protein
LPKQKKKKINIFFQEIPNEEKLFIILPLKTTADIMVKTTIAAYKEITKAKRKQIFHL